MLTSIQADMIRFVHDSPEVRFDDLVKTFDSPDSLNRVHYLVSSGILYRSLSRGDILILTPKGLAALDEYDSALQNEIQNRAEQDRRDKEHSAKQEKDKKQQFRHDFLVAAGGAAVGSLITGFIDHFSEICLFIEKLID